MDTGVGAGVYCAQLDLENCYRLPDHCSIFQAEILAINKAVDTVCSTTTSCHSVNIYIDSQAAIKSLEASTIKSRTVLECHLALERLSASKPVILVWVPGHKDVAGNEAADVLAKRGANLNANLAERVAAPIQSTKHKLDVDMIELAKLRWAQTPHCRITKIMWKSYDSKRTKALLSLKRPECSTLVGLLTGHCLVSTHASRMGLMESDTCRRCEDPEAKETVEHIICHCPALARSRLKTLGKPTLTGLEEASKFQLTTLLRFAKESKTLDLIHRTRHHVNNLETRQGH